MRAVNERRVILAGKASLYSGVTKAPWQYLRGCGLIVTTRLYSGETPGLLLVHNGWI